MPTNHANPGVVKRPVQQGVPIVGGGVVGSGLSGDVRRAASFTLLLDNTEPGRAQTCHWDVSLSRGNTFAGSFTTARLKGLTIMRNSWLRARQRHWCTGGSFPAFPHPAGGALKTSLCESLSSPYTGAPSNSCHPSRMDPGRLRSRPKRDQQMPIDPEPTWMELSDGVRFESLVGVHCGLRRLRSCDERKR